LWTAKRDDLICANGMFYLLRSGSQSCGEALE
jgi:hypothetical protein